MNPRRNYYPGQASNRHAASLITTDGRPSSMLDVPGNLAPQERQVAINGLGISGIATVLANMLKKTQEFTDEKDFIMLGDDVKTMLAWIEANDLLNRHNAFFLDTVSHPTGRVRAPSQSSTPQKGPAQSGRAVWSKDGEMNLFIERVMQFGNSGSQSQSPSQ